MYPKRNNEMTVLSLYTKDYSKQMYLREISRLSKLPLKTIQNTLKTLEQEKIIKSVIRGKNKYFMLNLNNIITKLYLHSAELYKTIQFLHTYPHFKSFMKSIETNTPKIVFGSFAKSFADKDSDVDILSISTSEQKLPTHLLPNKIQQINMSEKDFVQALEKKEPLIKEIEEAHIILNNHSFFINLMWKCYAR